MRLEVGSAYTILFLLMTLPLLIAMQWLGVDPAGAQSARAAAKRQRALSQSSSVQPLTQPSQPVETAR
jgi:putative spermidine/putrescine transport system permease protein